MVQVSKGTAQRLSVQILENTEQIAHEIFGGNHMEFVFGKGGNGAQKQHQQRTTKMQIVLSSCSQHKGCSARNRSSSAGAPPTVPCPGAPGEHACSPSGMSREEPRVPCPETTGTCALPHPAPSLILRTRCDFRAQYTVVKIQKIRGIQQTCGFCRIPQTVEFPG